MKRVVGGFICTEHFSISFHLISLSLSLCLSAYVYLVWFLFSKGYGLVEGSEQKREVRKGQLGHVTGNYTYRVFAKISDFNFIYKTKQWHCDTNRNIAGSIPDEVTGIFH